MSADFVSGTDHETSCEAGLKFAVFLVEYWPGGECWEFIEGTADNTILASGFRHQKVAGNCAYIFRNAFCGGPSVLCVAPTDVVLSECDIVQRNALVVCDEHKIAEDVIRGALHLVSLLNPIPVPPRGTAVKGAASPCGFP